MPVTRESISNLFQGVSNTPEEFRQEAVRLHKLWYWTGMMSLMALIAMEVVMSYMGLPVVISAINVVLMLTLGFYVSSPATFLSMLGVGAAWKFTTYNWDWRKLFEEGAMPFPDISWGAIAKQGWDTYVAALKLPAHFLIIAIAMGTTLALVRVEHPTYALMFFPALAAIGLWSFALGGTSKYYRKITIAVLVVGAMVSLYQMFGGHEKIDKTLSNLFYSKTLEFEVSSFQEKKICCVEPGNRKFSVPGDQYIKTTDDGLDHMISNRIRINDSHPGESFSVIAGDDGKGWVKVSFSGPSEFLNRSINGQILALAFR
jgi:hypothetical protein